MLAGRSQTAAPRPQAARGGHARFLVFFGLLLSAVLLHCSWDADAAEVTISNVEPRRDVTGRIMDAHDGNILSWNGLYYFYGMGYGPCVENTGILPPRNCPGIYEKMGEGCGFHFNHTINVFSSPDLVRWTFEGEALPTAARPRGVYFRPKVLFNQLTKLFVLWVNMLPDTGGSPLSAYPHALFVSATSPTPTGSFQVNNRNVSVAVGGGGDFTLMDAGDGDAYVAYDAWDDGHRVVVERLSDDFTDSLGATASSGTVSPGSMEAPILFVRRGWFYLFFGHTCCFCAGGAGSHVWVSRAALGPWASAKLDINPKRGGIGPFGGHHVVRAQENYVFAARTRGANGANDTTLVYTGDRWSSAPDQLKSHDFQHWEPLQWNDTLTPPLPLLLTGVDSFTLDLTD